MEELRHLELGELREGWQGPSSIVLMRRLRLGCPAGAQSPSQWSYTFMAWKENFSKTTPLHPPPQCKRESRESWAGHGEGQEGAPDQALQTASLLLCFVKPRTPALIGEGFLCS